MAVLTVVSAKGAPGATTTALLLASAGDAVQLPLLLEADPAGGDLAAQLGTLFEPGMASLVEEARWEGEGIRRRLDAFCRVLPTGAGVIVGSVQPKQVAAYVDDAPRLLGSHARSRGGLVVVDAGRWGGDAAAAWAQHSDAVVVLVQPTVDNAEHVAVRLDAIAELTPHVRVVMVDRGPLSAADVAEVLEWPVTALPVDADTVDALRAGRIDQRQLRSCALGRAATALLADLLAEAEAVAAERSR